MVQARLVTVFLLHRYDTAPASLHRRHHTAANFPASAFLLLATPCADKKKSPTSAWRIKSQELGGQFLNGCTGLLFMLPVDEPINLVEPNECEGE